MRRPAAALLATGLALAVVAVVASWLMSRGADVEPVTAGVGAGASDTRTASPPAGTADTPALPDPGTDEPAPLDPASLRLADAPAGRGTLLIRARWATGLEPAPGVDLVVTAWEEPDRDARTRVVRTDADGRVGFHEVAAGLVTVDAPRGGRASVELAADERLDLDIAVSDDLLVRGRVLDADGRPSVGASVWVSIHPGTDRQVSWSRDPQPDAVPPRLPPVEGPVDTGRGRIAARTDAAGRFELKGLAPGQGIAALDESAAPSPLVVLEDVETHTLDLTLTLGPPGAAVEGRVVDVGGSPVADAVVVVRPPDPGQSPAVRVLSDADGRFAASGLPAGVLTVESSVSTGAVREQVVGVPAGGIGLVTIVLPAPSSLAGTVLDAAGRPAAGTTVRMRQGTRFRSETAGQDGAFVFEEIAQGEAELTAWHAALGVARAVLTIGESGVHRWDPVLAEGHALRGRLLYDDGTPAAGLLVSVEPDLDGFGWTGDTVLVSDAEGRFLLENCRETRYRLTVGDARPLELNALLGAVGAAPGGDEVVVTVPRPAGGEARVHGRLAAGSPSPLGGATLLLRQSATREHVATLDTDSGAFRAGPVRAGDYMLALERGSGTLWPLARVAMLPGRDLDLGTLSVGAPGALVVHTEWAPGTKHATLRGWLLTRPGTDGASTGDLRLATLRAREDGTLRADGLPPGEHVLRVEGQTVAPACRAVTVTPGGTTVASVRLEVGVRTQVSVSLASGQRQGSHVTVRVELLDADGLPLGTWVEIVPVASAQGDPRRLQPRTVRLLPGPCHARVFVDGALLLEQAFVVAASDELPGSVTLAVP